MLKFPNPCSLIYSNAATLRNGQDVNERGGHFNKRRARLRDFGGLGEVMFLGSVIFCLKSIMSLGCSLFVLVSCVLHLHLFLPLQRSSHPFLSSYLFFAASIHIMLADLCWFPFPSLDSLNSVLPCSFLFVFACPLLCCLIRLLFVRIQWLCQLLLALVFFARWLYKCLVRCSMFICLVWVTSMCL